MSAKMAANGIRTHARTNQLRTLESRSRQSLNAGMGVGSVGQGGRGPPGFSNMVQI